MIAKSKLTSSFDFQQIKEDFRTLDPSNPGLWPAIPKALILLGVLIVCIIAAWFAGWSGQLASLDAARAEEQRLKEDWKLKKSQAVNLEAHKAQLEEINRTFGALLKQLPNASEVETLLVDINQAGLGHGLQFDLFQPQPEQIRDFYAELPIKIRLVGNYHELGAFAGDVAKLSRIVTLNDVEISVAKDSLLTLNTTAKTFRYLSEQEVAQQRKLEREKAKEGRK